MTIASSFHTMSNGSNSSATNTFLLPKHDLTMTSTQLIDILLHDPSTENKVQTVNRWCKNPNHNRLSNIIEVPKRYDVLMSLVNILKHTTNTEYQYNCLTFLSELQVNIQHYDQQLYLPVIIQCFSSTSNEVHGLVSQFLIKQIHATTDIPMFLQIYTEHGLKSQNVRIRVKSIESLNSILSRAHYRENISPILEILLQYLKDDKFRINNSSILRRALQHIKHILGHDILNAYLESYSPPLKRLYLAYATDGSNSELDNDEHTPKASVQASHTANSPGTNSFRSNGNIHSDNMLHMQTSTIPAQTETSDVYHVVESMRANWMTSNEANRLNYLEHLKMSCDKHHQILNAQYSSAPISNSPQYHQQLNTFLTSIRDLLSYITSINLDLSVKVKHSLATNLVWLIKHGQANYCRKNYTTLCTIFKNILFNGQLNNQNLSKLGVSIVLMLENFVHPQLILTELITDHYQYYNYRIQLELLAIVTATLLKYRQCQYENMTNLERNLLPMLLSNRRELRHGAMECFMAICAYLNGFRPLTPVVMETNQSIKSILISIENLSKDALNAFRYRLQRNSLPSLTDEGNITPGLVCDQTTMNDLDAKFIINPNASSNNNTSQTTTPMSNYESKSAPSITSKLATNNNKLLQLAMPFADNKINANDSVMRSREIPPLKPPNIDLDSNRYTNNNHSYEASANPTVVTTMTPAGSPLDFTITGNRNHRPLKLTEKIFPDARTKHLLTTNVHRKEPTKNIQQQENQPNNNLLQFRAAIPHRPAIGRFPAPHNILVASQIHNHNEQKLSARHLEANINHNDSAIDSRSMSNTTTNENTHENHIQPLKKPVRSVHSSSTRRKVNKLFNNGSDLESASTNTLTPENSNESGVYSNSGRDTEYHTNNSTKSINKDQLFSTKPRLARSGSKSKLDKTQILPSDPLLAQHHDNNIYKDKNRRPNKSNIEVTGRLHTDEQKLTRRPSNENLDDKPQILSVKPRTKTVKGSAATNSMNSTLKQNPNSTMEDTSNHENGHNMGVVGKAVSMPMRANGDTEVDIIDSTSDEFDSDSKENEHFVDMGQSLSASFRLRVQQKTREKIEQKERRRQDRENHSRQREINNNNSDVPLESDPVTSSTSTSRYSSQPDLTAINNDTTITPRRHADLNGSSILPNFPSQNRLRASKNFMGRSQTFNNRRDLPASDQHLGFSRPSSEDRIADQIKNPDHAYREAIESISNDDWEQKCSGLSLLQALIAQYPDTVIQNLHQVVLVLIQEVKNLRSQVARLALSTFCEMFKHLKRNMDIELDLTVKAILQKSAESNEFFRTDAEKCLQTMVDNVTVQKALQALIAGGASHRNPAARKTSAKCIYLVCEKLGAAKILSGTRDVTERVLQVAAAFASDGPPEIRWYGKKIYYMLMPYDELDSMMKHYLTPAAYTNMCEILDNIRAKGGVGETPSESARNNGRRALTSDRLTTNGLTNQFSSTRKINTADQAEQVRDLTKQMRSSDFRERLNGIEEFQKLCELETDTAIQSLVQIFDGFNECLADMNSKVVLKALNTMHQVIPILSDSLSSVINSALPLVAQNIASRNREISQLASEIIDTAIEYIDCGVLIQPLCTLSQNSNLRIRPEIVQKLATLTPAVCQRKPKQVEIHLLPTYWKLLSLLRGQNSTSISSSASGANSLNSSIHVLTIALYNELGQTLIEKANSSSSVTPQNLQLLRELCGNIKNE